MEKAGKASVGIVSGGFERDAMASARAFGMPQFRFARVPEVITGLMPDQIKRDVSAALDRMIEVLTTNADATVGQSLTNIQPATLVKIEAADAYLAFEKMNQQFLEQ